MYVIRSFEYNNNPHTKILGVKVMATKSFVTEFKFSTKSGAKLISAVENSRTREHVIDKSVSIIKDTKTINNIMDTFLGKRN
jgi:hypothetical protein